MRSLFKIEYVRVVKKTFLILYGISYPHILFDLSRFKVVIAAVLTDRGSVYPITVESNILTSRKRIIAVDFYPDINGRA